MANKESKSVRTLKSYIAWAEQFNDGEYVFRGVSNVKYLIEASTYRRLKDKDGNFNKQEDGTPEKLLKINVEILEDARRQGHGGDMKDLDLLAELQHRGAATCLIDFTKNPLVALWMACREGSRGGANGKIYAVDISSQFTFQPVTFQLSQEKDIDYFFQRDENGRYQLYQWQPKYQNSRMLAQQSIFLFGGAEIESAAECLIFKNSKQDVRNSLKKLAGITEEILFPDFDGFASQRAQNETYIEPDPQYYLQRGLDAYRESKVDEAIDYFTQGISLQSQDKDLLIRLYISRAFACETKGEHDLAMRDYNELIRIAPDYGGTYLNRGAAKYDLGLYKEAINDYEQAIRLDPNNADVYNNLGNAKSALGRHEDAISDYNKAIRLDPNHTTAHLNLGNAKSALGRYEDAISDYNKAIRLDPDDAAAYFNRGAANFDLNMYEKAIADYDMAIRLDPNDATTYLSRGVAKFDLDMYGDAIADYDMAIRFGSDDTFTYFSRGHAKSKLEWHEDAIADYDKAIRLDPDNATAYLNRGIEKFNLGQHEAAFADYDKGIILEPNNASIYNNRGVVKSTLRQYEAAIGDFDDAIRLKPDNVYAYNNRGVAKLALGLHEAAIGDFEEAMHLNPNHPESYRNRGTAKSVLGLLSDAEQDYQTALKLAEQTKNADLIMEITIQLDELNSRSGESQ